MGRKIYDEDLRLNLILNGEGLNKGSKKMVSELGVMEQELVKMEQEARKLAATIKNLEKNKQANSAALRQARVDYKNLNTSMRAHELQIESMRKQIGLAGMTVQQLRNHLNALKVQLFNMPGSAGTPMFKQLQREIQETEIRLRTLTTGASRMSQAWERLEKAANRAGTLFGWVAVGIFAITRVTNAVITRMKDLEDLMGTVRKNTNLFVGEVWAMKDAFDAWDTRTKTDDLLRIAIVAGKLGIEGKENIMNFVDAANKIQIALGDDLNGSVEDTINSVGKLTNAFRVLYEIDPKTGKKFTLDSAMLRTGDVLNQLAKSSAASAGTILEYMVRLSGVGELAKFSIAQIGGLASTLDALHVPSERGATALQKIMLQLANPKKIADFAEAMHLTVEEYKLVLANYPNSVLTQLLGTFVSTKNGLIELTGGLKDFGVRGQYMTAVIGSLGQNLDVVAQQQEIATKAWKTGTSVIDEYNIMNNNFTAEILKQQKIIRAQTDYMNKQAEPAVLFMVKAWAGFVVAMRKASDWIFQNMDLIKKLTFAYIALKAPVIFRLSNLLLETIYIKANTAAEQVSILWKKVSLIWTTNLNAKQLAMLKTSQLLTIANIAYTQGLRAAIVAMRGLSTSMYLFPGMAVVATVAALAGAFYLLVMREKELTEVEKRRRDLQKSIQDDFLKEKANLTVLVDRLKAANLSQKERADLIAQINENYKEYLPSLLTESTNTQELAKSYDMVVEAMMRKITYQKLIDAGVQNRTDYEANEKEIQQLEILIEKRKNSGVGSIGIVDLEQDLNKIREKRKDYINEYAKLQSDIAALAPKPKLDVNGNTIPEEETEETFKQRQADRDDAFKKEEIQIKEHYAKIAGSQDEMNAKLRAANIAYLRATIQDHQQSGRTEGEIGVAYWAAREKIADLILEGQKQDNKEVKEENKQRVKDAKEFEQDLIDIEKLRIEAITNEREKAIAQEEDRHLQSMSKNWKNDQALEYEVVIHNRNLQDINQKFLDKQLADKTVYYIHKEALLEGYWKQELISDEAYWTIKAQLAKDKEKELIDFKKQYGLYTNDELVNLEVAELKKGAFWILLTEEEKEKAIDEIRLRYGRARAKRLKKTLEDELNDIREHFTEQQQISYEQGVQLIPIFQKMGEGMGEAFSAMFDESQDAFKVFSKNMLLIALDEARKWIEIQYVKMLASNVSTMGPIAGIAVTGVEIGLIEAAFAAAKSMIGKADTSKAKQKAQGSYPVIGSDDGRLYHASYGGSPKTGVYSGPTLLNMSDGRSLVGERAPELVVDGDTFARIQLNAPGLLRDIYAYAGRSYTGKPVRQMAEGSYPAPPDLSRSVMPSAGGGAAQSATLQALADELKLLRTNGIPAYINPYGVNSLMDAQEKIAKFKLKVNKQ